MFEMRYKVETWEEYHDGLVTGKHIGKPVLQYRLQPTGEHFAEPPDYEWIDVPTVCVET